jgi:hypothetical protein
MSGYSVDTPYNDAVAVTPSDTTVYQPTLRAPYIGSITGEATLTVMTVGGSTVEFVPIVAGTIVPPCGQPGQEHRHPGQ